MVVSMSFPVSLSYFMGPESKGYASSMRMRVTYPAQQL